MKKRRIPLKKKLNIHCLLTLFRNPLHTLTYNYLMGALITNWRASKLFHRLICSSWVQIYQFPVLPITNQIEMWIRWLGLPFGMRVLFAYRTFQYPLITRTTTTMMTVMNSIPRENGSERLCLIPCAGAGLGGGSSIVLQTDILYSFAFLPNSKLLITSFRNVSYAQQLN